jgi:hypothetical protein
MLRILQLICSGWRAMSHASTASWAIGLLPSGATSAIAASLAWVEHLPGAIVLTILIVVFSVAFICTLAYSGYREQRRNIQIQTGVGEDYDRRTPSRCGGVLHFIRVKIINCTRKMLAGARLSVVNLNPENAGFRDFALARGNGITLDAGENTYIEVASHTEGIESSQVMCLQTSYPGGFAAPAGFGILTGEHRLQLRLTRNETHLVEIYCRLYVDDHNVMRLERLDKCEAQNGF